MSKLKPWPLWSVETDRVVRLSRILLVTGLCLAIARMAGHAEAGEFPVDDSLAFRTLPSGDDSLRLEGDEQPGSLRMSKSPALAVGLSAILPGAGQFYNESYWKVPIVLGLGGYFVAEWIRNDNLAEDFRIQYEESKTEDDPDGNSTLLATRDFYKNQRDTFVWYFVILYIANLVDAYVDANLYDFDVGEDLSLQVAPQMNLGREYSVGVGLRLEF